MTPATTGVMILELKREKQEGKQVVTMIGKQEDGVDDIVLVPVPTRFLPAVYRVLADGMAPASTDIASLTQDLRQVDSARGQNMIDLISEVARQVSADRQPVSLSQLHRAYLQTYPGIGKGNTLDSFSATVSFYTINMRSRFIDINNKRKPATWLSQPTFKRVGRGQYMLLSSEEIERFQKCVDQADDKDNLEDDPLVYKDDYDVDKLAPRE